MPSYAEEFEGLGSLDLAGFIKYCLTLFYNLGVQKFLQDSYVHDEIVYSWSFTHPLFCLSLSPRAQTYPKLCHGLVFITISQSDHKIPLFNYLRLSPNAYSFCVCSLFLFLIFLFRTTPPFLSPPKVLFFVAS